MTSDSSLSAAAINQPIEQFTRQQADAAFAQGHYEQASHWYEQLILDNSTEITLYWRLGLALLLQGKETEAQLTWMTPILEADSAEQQTEWTANLATVLQTEADRQQNNAAYETAWLLRQHLRSIVPDDLENALKVLELALRAQQFNFEDELLIQVTEALQETEQAVCSMQNDLVWIAQALLEFDAGHSQTLAFLKACLPLLTEAPLLALLNVLLQTAEVAFQHSKVRLATQLDRLSALYALNDFNMLIGIIHRLQHGTIEDLSETINLAERCTKLATTLTEQILAANMLLSSWIGSNGDWQRSIVLYQNYKVLLEALVQAEPSNLTSGAGFLPSMAIIGSLFFYFEDAPKTNRPLRNQLAQLAQTDLQAILQEQVQRYQSRSLQKSSPISFIHTSSKQLRSPRIGYFAGSLRQHSVGWLCRWLLKYHDRSRFDIHLYSSRPSDDWVQNELRREYGDRFHDVSSSIPEIADRIYDDQIDILVELDSLTSFGGCGVVALKPAPIQVHWLGYDASGMPAVDYFIADPYVLPDDAQTYYHEKIWRLPQTYIAVDGFEAHTPSLRRDRLNIPSDAVVFLSSQTGMKRNIDNARLQLQVVKAVPHSYFLIKSFRANPQLTEAFFRDLAESEGVSGDRLRFLPDVPSEFVHRANLALADVVLDTYPYNGATTTLEALWTGLPIVTRVGEQFAARNSYTMMMNTGITEGLAWSDAEYLEWGIRLGTDVQLRQNIFGRLKRSRHSSPLWNGRQFARTMEAAYEQMWKQA